MNRNAKREKGRYRATLLCELMFRMWNDRRQNVKIELRRIRNGILKRR